MRLNTRELTVIQLGGLICMPSILAGVVLVQHYQLRGAILALLLGNAILFAIARKMLALTLVERLSTTECVEKILGPWGGKFAALSYVIALSGWFAVNQHTVVVQLCSMLGSANPLLKAALLVAMASLNISMVLYGMQKLADVARYAMPLMVVMMVLFSVQGFSAGTFHLDEGQLRLAGLLLVVNMGIGMVFDIPTYYRFATSYQAGLKSLALLFFLFVPVVEGVGVILGSQALDPALGFALVHYDNIFMNLLLAAFFVFAGLMTNNANLYSLAVNSAALFKGTFHQRVLGLGALGLSLSFCNILAHFDFFLSMMTRCLCVLGLCMLGLYLFFGPGALQLQAQKRHFPRFLALLGAIAVVAGIS